MSTNPKRPEGQKPVFRGKYEAPAPAGQKAAPTQHRASPRVPDDGYAAFEQAQFSRLKSVVKTILIFVAISGVAFYGMISENMSSAMAQPIMYAACALSFFQLGKLAGPKK